LEDSYFCAQARRAGFEVLLDFARHAPAVTFGSEELRALSHDCQPWRP
jgi:hypothetical protein